MSNLQNNFTTPEQSKRLLELGVPADSCDFHYNSFMHLCQNPKEGYGYIAKGFEDITTPCWSVGRLIEILSKCMSSGIYTPKFRTDDNIIDTVLGAIELELDYGLDFSKLED